MTLLGDLDTNNLIRSMSDEAIQNLYNGVQRQRRVRELTNSALAQILIDLTDNHSYNSYFWHVMMEAAERISPELFQEAEKDKNERI